MSFAAPSSTTLTANTTYFLVLHSVGSYNPGIFTTTSNNEDSGAATGWSIADTLWFYNGDTPTTSGGSWAEDSSTGTQQIRVKGTVNPPAAPTALEVTPENAKLDLSWTAPSGTVTGYDVHYTSAPTSGSGAVTNDAAVQTGAASAGWKAFSRGTEADPPTASQSITGLSNDTAYRVRIRATNSNGSSSWVFGTGTPKAKTWMFRGPGYTITPGGSRAVQIELSVPAPEGGLEFTLERLLGTNVPTGLCDGATETKATAEDVGANPPTTLTVEAGETTGTSGFFQAADNGDDTVATEECFAVSASTAVSGWTLASGSNGATEMVISVPRPAIAFGSVRPAVSAGGRVVPNYAATIVEDAGTVSVPVTVNFLPATSTTYAVEVVTGQDGTTATEYVDTENPNDFQIATKSVTFSPSDTTRTKNLSVAITDDTEAESDETIVLRLASGDDHVVPTTGGRATLTISDNDDPPTTPPRNLRASSGHQKLDLSWEAPTTGTASGYDVHYTSAPTSGSGAVANDAAVQTGQTATAADGWVAVDRTGAAVSQEITGLDNDREIPCACAWHQRRRGRSVGAGEGNAAAQPQLRGQHRGGGGGRERGRGDLRGVERGGGGGHDGEHRGQRWHGGGG